MSDGKVKVMTAKFGLDWRALAVTCAATVAVLMSQSVLAMTSGRTSLGGSYVSGGVGQGEINRLEAQRDKHSLWVITAAKVSGAYLADVQIKVRDSKGRLMLDHKLDGPWLLVDLPQGRFVVDASFSGQTLRKTTRISPGVRHQIVFYFDVAVETLPDARDAAASMK